MSAKENRNKYFSGKLVLTVLLLFIFFAGKAQQTPSEIKSKMWNIHALRYYPFTQPADSFMMRVIERKRIPQEDAASSSYEKIAIDLTMNKQFLSNLISSLTEKQNFIFKYILLPYGVWLNYARPVREDSPDLNLTMFLLEQQFKENRQTFFSAQSPLEWIGTVNIQYYLKEWIGDINIWKDRNKVLFSSIKSPLVKDAGNIYRYFFSSRTEIDSIPVYEIAFFSQKIIENAFEGYLYISVDSLNPVKAVFTLNTSVKKSPAKAVLFTQTLSKRESLLTLGDEMSAGLLIEQVRVKDNNRSDSFPPDLLSPAQKEIGEFIKEARNTRAYSNLQNGLMFLYTDYIGISNDNFDLGPITQMFSYNYMEGLRIRVGGLTSQIIDKNLVVGGYLAYGTKDNRWKYRGDIIFYPRSKGRIWLTYVNDLNIPGYDCLENKRDRFYYSLNQANTKNMSLQKIRQLSWETDEFRPFSMKLNAKYTYDQPLGVVKYETLENGIQKTINSITTAEIGVSLRYSPAERHISVKGKRIVFNSSKLNFSFNHRVGIKGIFGSEYNYQITDVEVFKSFDFPMNKVSLDLMFSGGKIWNPVPFPLLFIPAGNQSYVFDKNNYNLMRFYEFTTDRFIAGDAEVHLKWSPVKLFDPGSKLKTHAGIKAIYGPLSDMNNPQLHPDLFIFNNGVEALGKKPYAEAHIGLSGIFRLIRIDYVYRLTYRNNYRTRGSFFVSVDTSL